MNLRDFQDRLKRSLAGAGLAGTAATLLSRAGLRHRNASYLKSFAPLHPFDLLHGVETGGLLFPEDLSSGKHSDLYNNGYFGIAPSVFRKLCGSLNIDYCDFTFIDLGSGKGGALLLASEFPFREIIGVELSPKLHRTAMENVARYRPMMRKCTNVHCLEDDAAEYKLPSGPLVLYMWNAFEGLAFERMLTNLETSLEQEPREIYVLYVHPEMDTRLTASRLLHRLWVWEIEMNEEDYQAYAFPPRREVCAVYKSILP